MLLEDAKERILRETGLPLIADSQVFRIGLQAIREIEASKLRICVDKCPVVDPGRPRQKPRECFDSAQIGAFLGLGKLSKET